MEAVRVADGAKACTIDVSFGYAFLPELPLNNLEKIDLDAAFTTELHCDFGSHFETTSSDAGPNCHMQVSWL